MEFLNLNLKIGLLNAENLFLLFNNPLPHHFLNLEEYQWQKLSTSVFENKPLSKTIHLARTILKMNVDILQLTEIGGLESLKNFNSYFLNDLYIPILIEGNSDRSIDVGFLIKKNVNFYFDITTHKNRDLHFLYPHERILINTNAPHLHRSHKFSRDCSELRLFNSNFERPFLILLLTHLKSPLDPEKIDPGGKERRAAELKTCIEIYTELKNQFPKCPILLSGDFNGNASKKNTDSEFLEIYQKTNLIDVVEADQVPIENRSTFVQIKSNQRTEGRQIDFCFIPESFKKYLIPNSAKVFEYFDELDCPLKRPQNLVQKLSLPSDHYPLVFNLENIEIR